MVQIINFIAIDYLCACAPRPLDSWIKMLGVCLFLAVAIISGVQCTAGEIS